MYHVLDDDPPAVEAARVRRLTVADLPRLVAVRSLLGASDPEVTLRTKPVIAAFAGDGRIVAVAQSYACTERHGDIGVAASPSHRERGLATAVSAEVCRLLRDSGRVPVWSCGHENAASLRVAEKLGFREVSRRIYLVAEESVGSRT